MERFRPLAWIAMLWLMNGTAAFAYFLIELCTVAKFEGNDVQVFFFHDTAKAPLIAWVRGIVFFLALGNFVPMLWLTFLYARFPRRSKFRDITICSFGSLTFTSGVFYFLMWRFPTPMISEAANIAITLTSSMGFVIVQILFAAYIEAVFRLKIRGRRRRGLCALCGYDLKKTMGPHCPECGCAHQRGIQQMGTLI